jgi:mycofactocin precursor
MSVTTSEQPTSGTGSQAQPDDQMRSKPPKDVELIEADLLVEDVSIDGMCGVY